VVGNPTFMPGERVETIPPGAVAIGAVQIGRDEQPSNSSCESSTVLSIEVTATDDATPTGELGYRLRVVSGTTPPRGFGDAEGDRAPFDGQPLVVFFRGAYADLDFELGVSAIDQSGNVGPETAIPIFDEAPPQGCNSAGAWSLGPGLALLALRRRRRRSHWC